MFGDEESTTTDNFGIYDLMISVLFLFPVDKTPNASGTDLGKQNGAEFAAVRVSIPLLILTPAQAIG